MVVSPGTGRVGPARVTRTAILHDNLVGEAHNYTDKLAVLCDTGHCTFQRVPLPLHVLSFPSFFLSIKMVFDFISLFL